ncbi:DNA internalization-related competence protein ComEC/Rec2 [Thermosediminibacter oceani]|uniref:DNA internalization-related competence protein ComEC/Rec2 n=1 Tax=Thermosediminibacter oceani (strain ATCC BAA-1034 / DSM 16646 / JW/IW-1228P) TaxID=555079 RepID=D9S2N0_THEOJ|nr:DNA internalization-related competence protein ComEC/Rec2 [Thermosediminibacter oceani]ADL07657.1 DNA internalization-related competence protein ComEC/Rec2 [Thermosediminibacter oceani DSM 16646]
MYRPFLFVFLFFAAGIVAGEYIKILWPFALALIAGFGFYFFARDFRKTVFLGIIVFTAGALYHNFWSTNLEGTIANYAGNYRTVVGVVVSPPEVDETKVTYEVKTLYILQDGKYIKAPGKIRVSVARKDSAELLNYGDATEFSGFLRIPTNYENPGGFDYRAYLVQKGITATMFSREMKYLGRADVNPLVKSALDFRERIQNFYRRALSPKLASLLSGIVLGLKGDIPEDVLKAFSDGGVLHVLTASGLNVGIVYAAVEGVLKFLKLSPRACFFFGNIAVLFYSLMAGMSPPVLRAAVMLEVVMLGRLIGRKSDPLNSLGFAGFLLLLANSFNIFSASFQLSFAATLGIILFFKPLQRFFVSIPAFFRDSLAVLISAQLLLFPFLAYYFHKISLAGFLLNFIIVPLAGAALLGGFLTGIVSFLPFFAVPIVKITGVLVFLMDWVTTLASRLPFATFSVPSLGPLAVLAYFALIAAVFAPVEALGIKRRQKFAVIGLCFLIVAWSIFWVKPGFEVTFLDVGQGDCIFIKTKDGGTVLIDGGGMPAYYKGSFDIGEDVVLPYLYEQGVRKLDVVVFTHFDSDHAGGLLSIIEEMDVNAVVIGHPDYSEIYRKMVEVAAKKKIPVLTVSRGDIFRVGEAVFHVLNPKKHELFEDDNDNSVVLKMIYRGFRFLFTGDLGFEGEKDVMAECDVEADVLKIAHHGSNTSTSPEFLNKVNPDFAVISVGKNNSFGHPSPRVIELLEKSKIKVFRTDIHGAISFKIRGNNVRLYTQKKIN